MTKLAYVGELRWRWLRIEREDPDTNEPSIIYEKVLGYYLDGNWKPIPTEKND